jgi:uncharacterized RDD family membrane protein YckC
VTEPLAPTTSTPALRPATIRRRLAAFVYEGILLFGIVFAAGLAFGVVMQQRNGLAYHNQLSAWIAVVVGVYFVGLWHASGQTLPMKTWRLRVVGPGDTPPSLGRAIIRYLAAWLWFLPPLALHPLLGLTLPHTLIATAAWFVLWAASARLGTARQFPHDRIAGTRVVDVSR